MSDRLERREVDAILAGRVDVADPDRVDLDAVQRRDPGRVDRRHLAGRIVAVREQDQHAIVDLAGLEGAERRVDVTLADHRDESDSHVEGAPHLCVGHSAALLNQREERVRGPCTQVDPNSKALGGDTG